MRASKVVRSWGELLKLIREFRQSKNKWVFRGQLSRWELTTALERQCQKSGIGLNAVKEIEYKMIRDFRRLYDGNDRETVREDTLYCLSLMQHYGAPTRLMDWTYSPFIATYFALEYAQDHDGEDGALWCLNVDWCWEKARKVAGTKVIKMRNAYRNEQTFQTLYMGDKPRKLVFLENPFLLHTRLSRQQGVFLCQGDVTSSLVDNLKNLDPDGYNNMENVLKIGCKLTRESRIDALEELHQMNIDRTILFPGLEGFAKSMNYRLEFYRKLEI